MLKKVVVVVNEDSKEFFEAEDLRVINPGSVANVQVPVLVIMDGKKDIAVFRKWHYWKKLE